jgi:hypothetical protein
LDLNRTNREHSGIRQGPPSMLSRLRGGDEIAVAVKADHGPGLLRYCSWRARVPVASS